MHNKFLMQHSFYNFNFNHFKIFRNIECLVNMQANLNYNINWIYCWLDFNIEVNNYMSKKSENIDISLKKCFYTYFNKRMYFLFRKSIQKSRISLNKLRKFRVETFISALPSKINKRLVRKNYFGSFYRKSVKRLSKWFP